MGEVYRAVHPKLGRVVAIKVLTHTAHSPGFTERFLNEARIQASLHHHNIATLYDFLEFNNQPCIIMEYVDGQVLVDRIRAKGMLPLSEATYIFQAIVEAIRYVHSHGIIHRDIKSNNVKVSSTGEVKLLDFGIAKSVASPGLTIAGSVVGTLKYLSPEQLKGQPADVRSDIWALGTLLYEMVTGIAPFEAPTLGELYNTISKANYIAPSSLNMMVPRELEAIIAHCMKKRSAERYQSAEHLFKDICLVTTAVPVLQLKKSKNQSPLIQSLLAQSLVDLSGFLNIIKKNWSRVSVALVATFAILSATYLLLRPPDPPLSSTELSENENARAWPAEPNAKSFQIDTSDGRSEVYLNGLRVGTTPYEFHARVGEHVDLLLRRDGFVDRRERFTVTENKRVYTFSMNKKQ